jgi:hypothetical protein
MMVDGHMHDHASGMMEHDHMLEHDHMDHKHEVTTTTATTTTTTTTTTTVKPRRKPKNLRNGRRNGRKFNRNTNKVPFNFVIPRTSFSCKGRAPGYYADMEAECAVSTIIL